MIVKGEKKLPKAGNTLLNEIPIIQMHCVYLTKALPGKIIHRFLFNTHLIILHLLYPLASVHYQDILNYGLLPDTLQSQDNFRIWILSPVCRYISYANDCC